ncbi:D-alanyl-D-alanine carboxypeptidase family protein [Paenibacillus sp. GXUN7292]|uniref:D-alanyl-D-alanine carboxypeptidase family protein n=1 Tax=Paenibacillus sp. GXUN7292 TaxID=3422499 RepID=UPI003D7CA5B2
MKILVRPMRIMSVIAASLAIWMLLLVFGPASVQAIGFDNRPSTENSLDLQVRSSILIEAESGQVLFEVNAEQAYPIASMTKLMTEYIVLEEIQNERLSWDDVITVTEEAKNTHPSESQIYLAPGDKHTVKELYIAMAVGSANDATKELAIQVAGSLSAFVDKMNEYAKNLGLESAVFTSVTGLEDTTVMSAADVAKLARIIILDHPEFFDFSTLQEYKFRERDKDPIVNLNYMLGSNVNKPGLKPFAYEGVDGMKTGFIEAAGYNFTGTVKRGEIRYISVVMDTRSKNARFVETAKLYDYAYGTFEKKTVLPPKSVIESLETVKIKKGVKKTVPIVTDKDITFMVKKGTDPKIELVAQELLPEDKLIAPIEAKTPVGTVTYRYTDAETGKPIDYTVNLITAEEAEKAGWFKLMLRAIGDFFANLFQAIVNLF